MSAAHEPCINVFDCVFIVNPTTVNFYNDAEHRKSLRRVFYPSHDLCAFLPLCLVKQHEFTPIVFASCIFQANWLLLPNTTDADLTSFFNVAHIRDSIASNDESRVNRYRILGGFGGEITVTLSMGMNR